MSATPMLDDNLGDVFNEDLYASSLHVGLQETGLAEAVPTAMGVSDSQELVFSTEEAAASPAVSSPTFTLSSTGTTTLAVDG